MTPNPAPITAPTLLAIQSPMGDYGLLITVVVIMVVVGTIAAIVWWSLADRFYPGADRATGQHVDIFEAGARGSRHASSAATGPIVIHDPDASTPPATSPLRPSAGPESPHPSSPHQPST